MVLQTTSHALFEMTTVCLNTGFESCSPLVNDPPRSARTYAISQPAAVANRLFCILLDSAVTFLRWCEQICSQLVSSFLRSLCTKNYWNRFIFDQIIPKIKKWGRFLRRSVLRSYTRTTHRCNFKWTWTTEWWLIKIFNDIMHRAFSMRHLSCLFHRHIGITWKFYHPMFLIKGWG